jgi:hypothetical protein
VAGFGVGGRVVVVVEVVVGPGAGRGIVGFGVGGAVVVVVVGGGPSETTMFTALPGISGVLALGVVASTTPLTLWLYCNTIEPTW